MLLPSRLYHSSALGRCAGKWRIRKLRQQLQPPIHVFEALLRILVGQVYLEAMSDAAVLTYSRHLSSWKPALKQAFSAP